MTQISAYILLISKDTITPNKTHFSSIAPILTSFAHLGFFFFFFDLVSEVKSTTASLIMGVIYRSPKKNLQDQKERRKMNNIWVPAAVGLIFGVFIGVLFMILRENMASVENSYFALKMEEHINQRKGEKLKNDNNFYNNSTDASKIIVPPRGTETLPPGIVVPESDFYLHRLWGEPSKDLPIKQKYLATFTVGIGQKRNIDAAVKKFSENFTILLFHYDGRATEWDDLEWSKDAIHISVHKQTKWWYAKRFLHPDIVASYDYIFMWDEDLGVENFNAEEYIRIVKKHGLQISQPGLGPGSKINWRMTRMKPDTEVHRTTEEKWGECHSPHLPPCAKFVEIMATVFSRNAWRCVWYMIQNDLVHGWGLDFSLTSCAEHAEEEIGVVDSQWIVHQGTRSLHSEVRTAKGKTESSLVTTRCRREAKMFEQRMTIAIEEKMHSLLKN